MSKTGEFQMLGAATAKLRESKRV